MTSMHPPRSSRRNGDLPRAVGTWRARPGIRTWLCSLFLVTAAWLHAAPPVLVTQSQSLEVLAGDAFAASVTVNGESATYQWFRDGAPVADGDASTLLLDEVTSADAGSYHARITNAEGFIDSDPVTLAVVPAPDLGIAPGTKGVVTVPGLPAYYDLYLPSTYDTADAAFPILFTNSPGGGGMVDHFRTVAEEKKWIVVGMSQSRNGQSPEGKLLFTRGVYVHALRHLKIDPNRIFVSGMSGGGWASFNAAKQQAPLMAGVFSMGGWLGRQYSMDHDIYLDGLMVARANGDSDAGANSWLSSDFNYLTNWIAPDLIRDWSFPGGHVSSPAWVQREVFDWFLAGTTASTTRDRGTARRQMALWKARLTAGDGNAVFAELVDAMFLAPRSANALAAWQTLDFLFAHEGRALQHAPPGFEGLLHRNFLAVHLYYALFGYLQHHDPAMLLAAAAAARNLGDSWAAIQVDPWSEIDNILRHPPHSSFDAFVRDHALYLHAEPFHRGDWDGDGRSNLGEFILGSDPLVPDPDPTPSIVIENGIASAHLRGCRADAIHQPAALVSWNPSSGYWERASEDGTMRSQLPDGTWTVSARIGNTRFEPSLFARFEASPADALWHDANGDGIPYEYEFPEYQLDDVPIVDDPNRAPADNNILVLGGTPLDLLYLTAAEIGPAGDLESSLRYHPALAEFRGYLCHEIWMDVPETTISAALAAVRGRPASHLRLITTSQAPWFASSDNKLMGDRYFERTRGYLVPDTTGNHVFSISGDDDCELWLASTPNSHRGTLIARVDGYTGYQDYTKSSTQTSSPVHLEAGASYYIEFLHREGNGGDHCSVSWIPPGSTTRTLIPSANLRCLPARMITIP